MLRLRWPARRRSAALTDPAGEEAPASLVRYLLGKVTSPRRASSVVAKAERFMGLAAEEQAAELPAVYLLLERYLVEVDEGAALTRERLRAKVRYRFPELADGPRLRLVFEPTARQEVLLCRMLLLSAAARARDLLGPGPGQWLDGVAEWVAAAPEGAGLPVPLAAADALPRREEEWVGLFGRQAEALYLRLEAAVGERGAQRIYEAGFREVFRPYSALESFPVVIGLLPDKLLDEDKIVLLSRRQVQRLVMDKAERLQRVNGQLVSRNAALQEAHAALAAAKGDLEERILARTAELREANASLLREVAERQRAEEALRHSEWYFRSLIENVSDAIFLIELDGVVRYMSPSVERLLGRAPEEMVGRNVLDLIHPEDREEMEAALRLVVESGAAAGSVQHRIQHSDGRWRLWEARGKSLLHHPSGARIVVNARDVTKRRQLEMQLMQSQKMEAIGRLAGGIAHDFNNLLTAITGHAEFLRDALPAGSAELSDAEEIGRAADRAAALTRQLLAFSRKQVLRPEVIDLNETVRDMEKMLRRLIGEDITLHTATSPDLGRAKADPGQIQQVIMNLVVNARDAMPGGGKITLETANLELDQSYSRAHVQVATGPYVMLAVSDTGHGMDRATQEQIFEPFFTTKELGKGTGLGLSTVYGIVKQSGGYVWVYSEVGQGTTFKVYLPRVDAEVGGAGGAGARRAPTGRETVLLVEDEPAVRTLARRVLQRSGYVVLEAADGEAALRLATLHAGALDLLLTDVVMPGMGGKALADLLRPLRPGLPVLFMSGYTDDAILGHGILAEGTSFLEKPFTPDGLAARVREVLDAAKAA